MKVLFLTAVLVGCGSYDATVTEKKVSEQKTTPAAGDPATGSDVSRDGPQKEGVKEPVKTVEPGAPAAKAEASVDLDPIKALSFTYIDLAGITKITSSAKIINTLYFTGTDAGGNKGLGRVKPDSSKVDFLPFGRMSANNITLDRDYVLPTNLDDYIYLIGESDIIQVDITKLEAIGKITSPCANKAPGSFIKDSRWNTVYWSKVTTCGMQDGAQLAKGPATDSYTGQPLAFDNYSSFSFDSVNVWRLSPRDKVLAKYSSTWATLDIFSTSGYLYNNEASTFVSDSNGGMWFFGCTETKCTVATAKFAAQ